MFGGDKNKVVLAGGWYTLIGWAISEVFLPFVTSQRAHCFVMWNCLLWHSFKSRQTKISQGWSFFYFRAGRRMQDWTLGLLFDNIGKVHFEKFGTFQTKTGNCCWEKCKPNCAPTQWQNGFVLPLQCLKLLNLAGLENCRPIIQPTQLCNVFKFEPNEIALN